MDNYYYAQKLTRISNFICGSLKQTLFLKECIVSAKARRQYILLMALNLIQETGNLVMKSSCGLHINLEHHKVYCIRFNELTITSVPLCGPVVLFKTMRQPNTKKYGVTCARDIAICSVIPLTKLSVFKNVHFGLMQY